MKSNQRSAISSQLVATLVLLLAAPAAGQVARLDGTSKSTFSVGANSATPLALTNSSGALSLSGGLVVNTADINGGTIDGTNIGVTTPGSGAFTTLAASGQMTSTYGAGVPFSITSTTKCTNLNADAVDGLSMGTVNNGGVIWGNGTSHDCISTGEAGKLLKSNGTNAPYWDGLGSGQLIVGSAAGLPVDRVITGVVSFSNTGVTSIDDGELVAADLENATADRIAYVSTSAGAEAADVIRVTAQIKDAQGNNLSGVFLLGWNIGDSSFSSVSAHQGHWLVGPRRGSAGV